MHLKLGFIGFGNVAREFVRILEERREQLERDYSLTWHATAIATGRHGCVLATRGIDLVAAAALVDGNRSLAELPATIAQQTPFDVVERCDADVIFETSPLDPETGQPAIDYIRSALSRRIAVVTANKGPIALAYRELRELAARFGVPFRFEGAVMDGTPVFNLVERCLPAARVLGFEGVLNSTTNLIIELMEHGQTFDDALAEAQRLGIAETNADFDIEGWDALTKARALANVLMDADGRIAGIERDGIRALTRADLITARDDGSTWRLVARALEAGDGITLRVAAERVPHDSLLACASATSNVLMLRTDLMGEIAIFEKDPGIRQTAYALLSDLLLLNLWFKHPLRSY
jgi:homoserine dehydrogenase